MVSILVVADACAIAVAWLASYWIRFAWLPASKGTPELGDKFLPLLPLVILSHLLIFYRSGLYRPRRESSIGSETLDIFKAFVAAVVVVVLIDYAMPESHKISRRFVATYGVLGTTCFALFRATVRLTLHKARERGLNRRTAAIVGSGRSAQRLLFALRHNAWTGIDVLYFIDDERHAAGTPVRGLPVRGPIGEISDIVERDPVDAVFIALPIEQMPRTNQILHALETSMADVRIVPELDPAFAMRPNVSDLDGVPILSLRQTPLFGWNVIVKRTFDLVIGSLCVLVAAIPMLLIALGVRLSSSGPVLYRQRRVGLDGREFDMFKFRTMHVDAEARGAVWSRREDERRTRIGAVLRRTSLDELPNLLNVLRGDMSLVGPRPERPEFIEQFKKQVPRYMLRHKMKAGMTGYAQVRGWRGDTSLRKRIQHDVHYIRNWSLLLDIRIFFQTVFSVWFSRHEA